MNPSYLKYIETTDMIDEGPTTGLTRLQHVGVVAVYDENGNEWFPPDGPMPDTELEIVTEAYWDESNVYKLGETIKAITATFTGGEEPIEYFGRFQYQINDDDGWKATDKIPFDGVTPTECSFLVPDNCKKVKFLTAAKDNNELDVAALSSQSDVLPAQRILQPSVTFIQQTPTSPTILETMVRESFRVNATGNYELNYTWQFEDTSGTFRNASVANLEKYYPNAFFVLLDGFQTSSLNVTWFEGAPAPPTFRCRIRDNYSDDIYNQLIGPLLNVTYQGAAEFDEQEFELIEEPTFSKTEGPYQAGDVLTVDSFGLMTMPFHTLTYYWYACSNTQDINDINNYRQRGSNEPCVIDEISVMDGYDTWRLLVFYETDEVDDEGKPKQYNLFSQPQTFN